MSDRSVRSERTRDMFWEVPVEACLAMLLYPLGLTCVCGAGGSSSLCRQAPRSSHEFLVVFHVYRAATNCFRPYELMVAMLQADSVETFRK